MKSVWDNYKLFFIVASIIFASGASSAMLNSVIARVQHLEDVYGSIPASLARIEQKVDDLRGIERNGNTNTD